MSKKLLLAFDDSENAMRAVNFLIDYFERDCWITLFSVLPTTEALCQMDSPGLTPYFKSQQTAFCALEDKNKELIEEVKAALASHPDTKLFHVRGHQGVTLNEQADELAVRAVQAGKSTGWVER